jgi:hypothetical protein
MSHPNSPFAALPLKSAFLRIPARPKIAIGRAELRFTGRNYRFVELRFLFSSGSVVVTLELSTRQTWNLAKLLNETINRFPE